MYVTNCRADAGAHWILPTRKSALQISSESETASQATSSGTLKSTGLQSRHRCRKRTSVHKQCILHNHPQEHFIVTSVRDLLVIINLSTIKFNSAANAGLESRHRCKRRAAVHKQDMSHNYPP